MKKVGSILIFIILFSTLGVPQSQGLGLDMQEDGETALIGLIFILALTGTNSTIIYDTPETTISYIHLNVSNIEPMFVIETTSHNTSSKLDFYIIKEGVPNRFATLGINVASMTIWVEYPTPDLSSWNYYEFQFSDALQRSE